MCAVASRAGRTTTFGEVSGRIALATCATFPQLADDEPLLLEELTGRGVPAEPAVWDDSQVDWSSYELVVVRCTWDYTARRDEFLAWADSLPRVLNSPEVLRWNTDKRYLAELPHSVATQFVEAGTEWELPAQDYVIKPTISAGARDTARYRPGEEAAAEVHLQALARDGRTAMIQPYLSAVDGYGETGLIFFEGTFSHAIRKGQILVPGEAPRDAVHVLEEISARVPSPAELRAAEEILDALPWPRRELLYARVDLIPGPDGAPTLLELELTEPSLFLSCGEDAAARLAERILRRA
jgi:glutathione synthase/RimK-type ligase-like ATP-grasp enzyme